MLFMVSICEFHRLCAAAHCYPGINNTSDTPILDIPISDIQGWISMYNAYRERERKRQRERERESILSCRDEGGSMYRVLRFLILPRVNLDI